MILANNHTSGGTKPSRAGEALTQILEPTHGLVGVRVLDHFIVTGHGAQSMAEMGLV